MDVAPSFLPRKERTEQLLPLWKELDHLAGENAQFNAYFSQRVFRETSGRPISFYLVRKTPECVLVLANQAPAPAEFTVSYAPNGSGLPEHIAAATDCFTGHPVETDGRQVRVPLDGWAFRLVRLRF